MGWLDVPLLCTMEIPVPGAMAHCIRVLLHVESDRQRSGIQHVYLGDAQSLRPDISEVRPAPESRPPRQD
jgi:chorismate mutase